jgi:hypothetical protein
MTLRSGLLTMIFLSRLKTKSVFSDRSWQSSTITTLYIESKGSWSMFCKSIPSVSICTGALKELLSN